MTESAIARAPGKLFLTGEYAVLDGAPAALAAMQWYVTTQVRRTGAHVVIDAPDLGAALTFNPSQPPPPSRTLRFAVAAYTTVAATYPRALTSGVEITVASDGPPLPGKVGLGSSAAVTVAVTAALLALSELACTPDAVFASASAAHRQAQNHLGSGADVAASVYGGITIFQPGVRPNIRHYSAPAGLRLLAGWTGASAASEALVARYFRVRRADAMHDRFLQQARTAAAAVEHAVRAGNVPTAAIDAFGQALDAFAAARELPVFTASLRHLVRIARRHGAAAKPSGAGGGDCGIAITRDPDAAARIRSDWRQADILPLDIAISSEGVSSARC